MEDNFRILIFTNVFGGLYYFRKELVEEIAKKYSLICALPYDERFNWFAEIGCKSVSVDLRRRGMNVFSDVLLLFRYILIIKRHKPSLVLTYTIKPNLYGGIASIIFNVPFICNITGIGTSIYRPSIFSRILLAIYNFVLRHSSFTFFQNQDNLRLLGQRLKEKRIYLLPGSGVNLKNHKLEEYPSVGPINFLFVGRIMQDKGIDEFIDAAIILKNKYMADLEFFIVGPMEEERYSEKIESAHKDGILSFYGFQKNVIDFYKVSHAVINTSYHEGMSNVLLEAAATGRPVLASNVPGCREAFDEGISGFGFEPRSVDSLVQAIERFIALPHEQKAAMGLAGRKKMEREFDRQIVVDAYMREIENILEENNKKDKKK